MKIIILLRERKRHTTRQVSSTPSAVLSRGGVPHLWLGGTLTMARGTPSMARVSTILIWLGEVQCPGVHPILDWGTPPSGKGYPLPCQGTWGQSLGYPPERTWDQWKYYGMEME